MVEILIRLVGLFFISLFRMIGCPAFSRFVMRILVCSLLTQATMDIDNEENGCAEVLAKVWGRNRN